MDGIAFWFTPALLVALFAWLRFDMRELRRDLRAEIRRLHQRLDESNKRFDERLDESNKRFDQVQCALGDLRERMAKLEGALEGFPAGRRDLDAA